MSDSASILQVERAVSLAAWASTHLLSEVPFEDDDICAHIAWADDDQLGRLEDALAVAFSPNHFDGTGTIRRLQYYHCFEHSINASRCDANGILNALSRALHARMLPSTRPNAYTFDRYVVSCHGITLLPHTSSAPPPPDVDYLARIAPDPRTLSSECEPLGSPTGWSDTWLEWYTDRAGCNWTDRFLTADPRLWTFDAASQRTPSRLPFAERMLHVLLGTDYGLHNILRTLICSHRADITPASANWGPTDDIDVALRSLRDDPRYEPPTSLAKHLLLHVDPTLSVSLALVHKYITSIDATSPRLSPPEELTDLMIQAYVAADRQSDLERLVSRADGPLRNKVLRLVLQRADPVTPLTELPLVSEALARSSCAPLALHNLNHMQQGDRTRLAAHVRRICGYHVPPRIDNRHGPPSPSPPRRATRDLVVQGRRRAEYIFKTALQYVWLARRYPTRNPTSLIDDCPRKFWEDCAFWDVVAHWTSDRFSADHAKWRRGSFDLSSLEYLSGKLCQCNDMAVPRDRIVTSHLTLRRLCNEHDVPLHGNRAAHDNPMTTEQILEAVTQFWKFETSAFALPDLLPHYYIFTELKQRVNDSTEFIFKPFLARIGARPRQAVTARFSGALGHDQLWRGDRIYSLTDVTPGTTAIDPVVLDWTEWLTNDTSSSE